MTDLDPKAKYWMMYANGSFATSLGGVGVIILSLQKDVLKYGVQLQFLATNNEAEYEAILTRLRIAKALGPRNLKLNTDSKLVVGHINSEYEAKEERMKRYLKLTNQLIYHFDDVRIDQVPREENLEANKVAKLASSNGYIERPGLYMEVQTVLSIKGLHVSHIQSANSWMDLILTYTKDGKLPLDL